MGAVCGDGTPPSVAINQHECPGYPHAPSAQASVAASETLRHRRPRALRRLECRRPSAMYKRVDASAAPSRPPSRASREPTAPACAGRQAIHEGRTVANVTRSTLSPPPVVGATPLSVSRLTPLPPAPPPAPRPPAHPPPRQHPPPSLPCTYMSGRIGRGKRDAATTGVTVRERPRVGCRGG